MCARHDSLINLLILFIKIISSKSYESKIYENVMKNVFYKMKWQLIMNIEVDFYIKNCIWEMIVETSNDHHVFKNKWIYKFKREIDEKMIRFKTHWIIQNFKQRKDLDYNKMFVVIIKLINYKIIFAIIVVNDWNLKQMNVIIVFFYKNVKEKIYMKLSIEYK